MYPNTYPYAGGNGANGGADRYGYPQHGGYPASGYPFAPAQSAPGMYAGAGGTPPDRMAALSYPGAFESMYNSQLAQLTFNSKPIITNLTLIAQEHSHRMATLVAKLIDTHIITAIPPYRLPAMYLLDSISKNIGSPYTELWAPRIPTLLLESYRVVDQPTKVRLEELLATWRTSGSGGRPLFGENAQSTIERSLFGSQGAPARRTAPSQAQVLASTERLLALKTQERARNPSDVAVPTTIELLQNLKDQVQETEDAETLIEIQKELDRLGTKASTMRETRAGSAQPTGPAAQQTETPFGGGAASNASDLIANLMRAGLIPGATSPANLAPAEPRASLDKYYTEFIMSLDLRLTNYDMARHPPELELLIQENLPLQCRQCANRYPDTPAGKNSRDAHLDWHFTQNRRFRTSIARGQSRAWLDPLARWVRGGFGDVLEQKTDAENDDLRLDPAQEKAMRDKFASTYVVAPEDPVITARPCRICKEKFQSEWSEDVEEWIWGNAVDVDGAFYHASCYYSAKSMSDSVGVIRKEDTPLFVKEESMGAPLKRKAESDEPAPLLGEQVHPTKKLPPATS